MKKLSSLLLILGVFLSSFSFANLTVTDQTKIATLGDLNLAFCNEGQETAKVLKLSVKDDSAQEICVSVSNKFDEDVSISLNFIDGSITNDNYQHKSCKLETEKTMFGQYVSGFITEPFVLKANSVKTMTGLVKFPEGFAGIIPGCVTYYLNDAKPSDDHGIMKVLSRKANIIEVFVDGTPISAFSMAPISGKYDVSMGTNLSNNDFLSLYRTSNGVRVLFELVNTGNIPQSVNYDLVVNGSLGYTAQQAGSRSILPYESSLQSIELVSIPWYVWNVNVQLSGVSLASVPDGMSVGTGFQTTPSVIYQTVSISIVTWLHFALLGLIVFLLFFLFFLIRRRKKQDVVQNIVSPMNVEPNSPNSNM